MPVGQIEIPGSFVESACPVEWDHPLNRGLVAAYNLVPNSGWIRGLKFKDAVRGSKNAHDGTLHASTIWAGRKAQWTNALAGPINCGVDFLPTSAVTVLLGYRKTDATARVSAAFGFPADSPSNAIRCGATLPYSDGNIYWDFGGLDATHRLSAAWTADVLWHDWAFTSNGVNLQQIYKDGLLYASKASAGTRTLSSQNFHLGSGGTVNSDAAQMSYCLIFDRALPSREIELWHKQARRGNPETLRWVKPKTWSIAEATTPAGVIVGPFERPYALGAFDTPWR